MISAGLSVLPGYKEKVCVKCTNNFQDVFHRDLEVTQNGKCLQSLSKKPVPKFEALEYNKNDQKTVIS